MAKFPKLPKAKPKPKPSSKPAQKGGMFEGGIGSNILEGFVRGMTGNYNIEGQAHQDIMPKSLGMFGQGMVGTVVGADLPVMETPQTVSPITNPSISSIVKQLNSLLTIASKISLTLKMEQEALVKMNADNRRMAKEQQMEAGGTRPEITASPMQSIYESTANALTVLAGTIKKLDDVILIKSQEIGTGGSSSISVPGFGGRGRGMGALSAVTMAAGVIAPAAFAAPSLIPNFMNFEKEEKGISALSTLPEPADPGGETPRQIGSPVGASAGDELTSRASERMMAQPAGPVIKGVSKETITNVAKPLVEKSLNQEVMSNASIASLVGAKDTDTKEIESSITKIIANSVYKTVYGNSKEKDPQADMRMKDVMSTVQDLVKNALQKNVQPKQAATQTPGARTPTINVDARELPGGAGIKPGGGGGGGAPAASMTGASSSDTGAQMQSSLAPSIDIPTATPMSPKGTLGADVLKAQEANGSAVRSLPSALAPSQLNPSTPMLRSGSGRMGVGRVPDPTYYGSGPYDGQLFFGASA